MNKFIEIFDGEDQIKVLPAYMSLELLSEIATSLAKYKGLELEQTERNELEVFGTFWTRHVLNMQPSGLQTKIFAIGANDLALIGLSELEYFVREEIVARQIGRRTTERYPGHFFDDHRFPGTSLDYFRAFLWYSDLELFSKGDFSGLLDSVSKLVGAGNAA